MAPIFTEAEEANSMSVEEALDYLDNDWVTKRLEAIRNECWDRISELRRSIEEEIEKLEIRADKVSDLISSREWQLEKRNAPYVTVKQIEQARNVHGWMPLNEYLRACTGPYKLVRSHVLGSYFDLWDEGTGLLLPLSDAAGEMLTELLKQ